MWRIAIIATLILSGCSDRLLFNPSERDKIRQMRQEDAMRSLPAPMGWRINRGLATDCTYDDQGSPSCLRYEGIR